MFMTGIMCLKPSFIVQAPCEAEAQCAALVKGGKVFATATEDMDALTFGTNVLLRHLTFSEARFVYLKGDQRPYIRETIHSALIL